MESVFVLACENHPSWSMFFDDDDVMGILMDIEDTIADEQYYPECKNVLRFATNDLDHIKHVIVGMDPYPSFNILANKPQATGRSFEVSELDGKGWDYKIKQSSLRNILKAIYFNETGINDDIETIRAKISDGSFRIVTPIDWFDSMELQGVLFLNSTLTVAPNKPGSHKALWEPFRVLLVQFLSGRSIAWHLWGNDAQKEYRALLGRNEWILDAPHPRMPQFVPLNTFQFDDDVDWTGTVDIDWTDSI